MRLGAIVLRIRSKNTHFGEYVGGVVELDTAIKNTLKKDIAFVIPLIDDAGRNEYDTTYNHKIIERFGVVVALANDSSQSDKLGFLAYDQLHDIRGQLISALCGWIPIGAENQVMYRGGKLIDINNAYLWYQFEFEFDSRIIQVPETGEIIVQESDFDDSETPVPFNTIYMQLINTPDARIPHLDEFGNDGEMPFPDGFPNVNLLDNKVMSNWIDLTDNPNAGAFTGAFQSGFDVDKT
jgi:hypothetical protein